MAKMTDVQKPADALKSGRMMVPKKFAGKAALVSELTETAATGAPMLASNFSRIPDQILAGMTSEREISDQVGAPMRIVTSQQLGGAIGLDEADRFLAEAEKDGSKKS